MSDKLHRITIILPDSLLERIRHGADRHCAMRSVKFLGAPTIEERLAWTIMVAIDEGYSEVKIDNEEVER